MPSPDRTPLSSPLPKAFLERLASGEEVLVSSRGRGHTGSVRMWFAISPRGYVYLLTPAFSLKAQRWREDPWVRLMIPGEGMSVVGHVRSIGMEEVGGDLPLILSRFALAGAVTAEALTWMLESGSHLLLRVEANG